MTIETYDDWADVYSDILAERNSLYRVPATQRRVKRDRLGAQAMFPQDDEGYFGSTGAAIADWISDLDLFGESPQRGPFGLEAYRGSSGMGFAPFTGNMLEGQYYAPIPSGLPVMRRPLPNIGTDPQSLPASTSTSGFSEADRQYTRPTFSRDTAEAPSMWGANAQGDVSATESLVTEEAEVPTFGPDFSGVRRIEEMYAAGYISLAEAEELRRQEIQNIYADLYSQYDSGAEEFATRQLATEQMLEGKRQTLADDLASYGYDSSGFDAEMQGIDEIRGMDQAASGDLLDRLSEIARTGEAGALSGLSESAMMAKSGMEMQEMAAIQAEEQQARANAAAQQAAYLQQQLDAQNFEIIGQVFGMPAQVAQSLDSVGLLDNQINMMRQDAINAQAQAQEAITAANESAAQLENSQLGAELMFNDPSLWPVFDLLSEQDWVREDFGFGAGPEPTPNWIDLITKNNELIALYPDALAEVENSFGNISFDDAMMAQILMSMLVNSPEGDAFLVDE